MSDMTNGSGRGPDEQPSNRRQLDKLIFDQNLDEVHLLIDFISGRADRSLAALTILGTDTSTTSMNSRQIIEKITEMRYPPGDSDAINADNAAILLLAKDRLSALAAPARGVTIAYTAMFIDAEVKTLPARLWDRLFAADTRKAGTVGGISNQRLSPIGTPAWAALRSSGSTKTGKSSLMS